VHQTPSPDSWRPFKAWGVSMAWEEVGSRRRRGWGIKTCQVGVAGIGMNHDYLFNRIRHLEITEFGHKEVVEAF